MVREHKPLLYSTYKGVVKEVRRDGTALVDIGDAVGVLQEGGRLRAGDEVLVCVRRPSFDGPPLLTTRIVVSGRYMRLIRGSERVTLSEFIRGHSKREELLSLGFMIRPRGWGVRWRSSAGYAPAEELLREAEELRERAREVEERGREAPAPSLIEGGEQVAEVLFPLEAKRALDEVRNQVVPTVKYHHYLKCAEGLSERVDFAEYLLSRGVDREQLSRALLEYHADALLSRPEGSSALLLHYTIPGEVVELKGRVDRVVAGGVLLRRRFAPRGRYDGISEVKEEGDEEEGEENRPVRITTSYPVLRGSSESDFEFSVDIHNDTDKDDMFSLRAEAPEGHRRAEGVLHGKGDQPAQGPDVGLIAGADDEGRHQGPDAPQGLEGPGHGQHVLEAEGQHLIFAAPEGQEEGEDQLEGIAGLVARAGLHVGEIVVVTAEDRKELIALGDEVGTELHGVVVLGYGALAIGDEDLHGFLLRYSSTSSVRQSPPGKGLPSPSSTLRPCSLSLPSARAFRVRTIRGCSLFTPSALILWKRGRPSPSRSLNSPRGRSLTSSHRGSKSSPRREKEQKVTTGPRSSSSVTMWIMAPVSSAPSSINRQITSCHAPVGPPGKAGWRFIMGKARHISGLTMSM